MIDRSVVVLLALLLVAVPVTATYAQGGPMDGERLSDTTGVNARQAQESSANYSRTYLQISGPETHAFARPSFDLGSAVSMGDSGFQERFRAYRVEDELRKADDKEAVVRSVIADIRDRLNELRSRQQTAVQAYARGEITQAEFTRRMSVISARAANLQETLKAVSDYAVGREMIGVINSLLTRLDTFTGPAHDQLIRAHRGESSVRVSVTVTETGYVLGVLDRAGETFNREAYRYDYRDREGEPKIDSNDEAIQRIRELYPETDTDVAFLTGSRFLREAELFKVRLSYPEGPTILHLDATTGDVFYETKRQTLDSLPTSVARNQSAEGVRVLVNRTYATGPFLVRTVDVETGQPVDMGVSIDGKPMGRTGEDGTLWLIEPSQTYTLTLEGTNATVNVTVSPSG